MKKLQRTRERVVAGVCGGIGKYFDIDPVWVRLAFILLILIDGIGLILYVLAWILIPPEQGATRRHEVSKRHVSILGVALVLVGGVLLMRNLFSWFSMRYIWPLILIVVGLLLIMRRRDQAEQSASRKADAKSSRNESSSSPSRKSPNASRK